MPHSVTEDPLGNGIWVTDVGLHQVLLLNSDTGKIVRSFGERMVPGADGTNHFCKPTHVAFSTDNSFIYISDGYCNARVLKLAYTTGKLITQWGHEGRGNGEFSVPHALAIHKMAATNQCGMEGKDSVFVCDRENFRIQIFDDGGKYLATIQPLGTGNVEARPYAIQTITFPNQDPVVVAGLRFSELSGSIGALLGSNRNVTFDPCSASRSHGQYETDAWKFSKLYPMLPKDMREPHMLDVDPRSLSVYVAEMLDGSHSGRVFKFHFKSTV